MTHDDIRLTAMTSDRRQRASLSLQLQKGAKFLSRANRSRASPAANNRLPDFERKAVALALPGRGPATERLRGVQMLV
jgi:hypothetical protein